MIYRRFGYCAPVRHEGPEIPEEITAFWGALIDLALVNYVPGRSQDVFKTDYGKTVITVKVISGTAKHPEDRLSIRVKRGEMVTQFFAAITFFGGASAKKSRQGIKNGIVN